MLDGEGVAVGGEGVVVTGGDVGGLMVEAEAMAINKTATRFLKSHILPAVVRITSSYFSFFFSDMIGFYDMSRS